VGRRSAGQAAQHQRTLTTNHHQSGACGHRHTQGGEHQRRGALQGVLPREPVAKCALEQQQPNLHRVDPGEGNKHTKHTQRRHNGLGRAMLLMCRDSWGQSQGR
jgi:hypothetical protein